MTTVTILPIFDADGEKNYRAIAGDKHSVGKTAGQALDALTTQLGETEFSALLVIQNFSPDTFFSALLVIQNFSPDTFFSAKQQKRLSELMSLWRLARDHGLALPLELQAELDTLVEAELKAAAARTTALIQQESLWIGIMLRSQNEPTIVVSTAKPLN